MDISHNWYDIVYGSLRETLIPMHRWIVDVCKFESSADLEDAFKDKLDTIRSMRRWAVPYPYKYPVYNYMLKSKGERRIHPSMIKSFTEDERVEWLKQIETRVDRFIDNAISDEMLSYYDNSSHIGLLVNTMDGKVIPYNRCDVTSVEFSIIPFTTFQVVVQYTNPKKMSITGESFREIVNYFTKNNQMNDFWMYIRTTDLDTGKRITGAMDLSHYHAYSLQDIEELIKYYVRAIQLHKKVILV